MPALSFVVPVVARALQATVDSPRRVLIVDVDGHDAWRGARAPELIIKHGLETRRCVCDSVCRLRPDRQEAVGLPPVVGLVEERSVSPLRNAGVSHRFMLRRENDAGRGQIQDDFTCVPVYGSTYLARNCRCAAEVVVLGHDPRLAYIHSTEWNGVVELDELVRFMDEHLAEHDVACEAIQVTYRWWSASHLLSLSIPCRECSRKWRDVVRVVDSRLRHVKLHTHWASDELASRISPMIRSLAGSLVLLHPPTKGLLIWPSIKLTVPIRDGRFLGQHSRCRPGFKPLRTVTVVRLRNVINAIQNHDSSRTYLSPWGKVVLSLFLTV